MQEINYINLEDFFWCEVDGIRYYILADGESIIKFKK